MSEITFRNSTHIQAVEDKWTAEDERRRQDFLAFEEQAAKQAETNPTEHQARKEAPMARGLLDYFPDALLAVANCSFVATQQHHPDKEMHWDREKSTDHADCCVRHLMGRGKFDTDGVRHSAKAAWRALALLQTEIESER